MPLRVMVKNSLEGNRDRVAKHRKAQAERGIRALQVMAPQEAHGLIRQAVHLMNRSEAPMEPRAALRRIGGANEPEEAEASPTLAAELEAAKEQITQIEMTAKRQREALEAERDAAMAAQAAEHDKAQATATEAQAAARTAQEAQERAMEALGRAEKAETAIRQARSLPGVRGRLLRWLAGDALE
jgi:hypothetical protein